METIFYYSVDKSQLNFALISALSLKKNNKNIKIGLIFLGDLQENKVKKIKNFFDFFHIEDNFYDVIVDNHISMAAYLRYKVYEIWNNFDLYVYLDADTLIKKELNFSNFLKSQEKIAMVEDFNWRYLPCAKRFNLENYFNSGVILFKKDFFYSFEFKNFLNLNKTYEKFIKFHDQCTLNILFHLEKIKVYELDSKFNYLSNNFISKSSFPSDAHIIHFNAFMGKPWQFICFHPEKNNWRKMSKEANNKWLYEIGSFWKIRSLIKNKIKSFF
tara:strand:+ start:1772 stop:2587 length:816 start_codon:yes stop_codon:yes gene_type:complete